MTPALSVMIKSVYLYKKMRKILSRLSGCFLWGGKWDLYFLRWLRFPSRGSQWVTEGFLSTWNTEEKWVPCTSKLSGLLDGDWGQERSEFTPGSRVVGSCAPVWAWLWAEHFTLCLTDATGAMATAVPLSGVGSEAAGRTWRAEKGACHRGTPARGSCQQQQLPGLCKGQWFDSLRFRTANKPGSCF